MKTIVIGAPDTLPPELAENPEVIVVDPDTLPEEVMAMLDAATGGMLGDDGAEDGLSEEGGEGPLQDWAGEEEREHGMGGAGDEEEEGSGEGDEEEDPTGGSGDDEDEEKAPEPPAGGSRGRGGKTGRGSSFGVTISGRGAAIPALSRWAQSMGRGIGRLALRADAGDAPRGER